MRTLLVLAAALALVSTPPASAGHACETTPVASAGGDSLALVLSEDCYGDHREHEFWVWYVNVQGDDCAPVFPVTVLGEEIGDDDGPCVGSPTPDHLGVGAPDLPTTGVGVCFDASCHFVEPVILYESYCLVASYRIPVRGFVGCTGWD